MDRDQDDSLTKIIIEDRLEGRKSRALPCFEYMI